MSTTNSFAKYAQKNVRNVSPHIKRALLDEAQRREITMNDVVGEILATRYNATYSQSGVRTRGAEIAGDQLLLRLPRTIIRRVWEESRRERETESSVVIGAIATHFGLIHEPVYKGRRRDESAA